MVSQIIVIVERVKKLDRFTYNCCRVIRSYHVVSVCLLYVFQRMMKSGTLLQNFWYTKLVKL